MVRPGLSRPQISSHPSCREPNQSPSLGGNSARISNGNHTSATRNLGKPIPTKSGAATPTITNGLPFNQTVWPTTFGSLPKCACQNELLKTATEACPGTRLSSGVKARPRTGFAPSTAKKLSETNCPKIDWGTCEPDERANVS